MLQPEFSFIMIGLSRYWMLIAAAVAAVCVLVQNQNSELTTLAAAAASHPSALPVALSAAIVVLFWYLFSLCSSVVGSDFGGFDAGSQFLFQVPPPEPGASGLHNLGNSCYMSCSLTCISNCAPVTAYFLSGAYSRHVNNHNASGTQGRVARAFAALLNACWLGNKSAVSPASFKVSSRCAVALHKSTYSTALPVLALRGACRPHS